MLHFAGRKVRTTPLFFFSLRQETGREEKQPTVQRFGQLLRGQSRLIGSIDNDRRACWLLLLLMLADCSTCIWSRLKNIHGSKLLLQVGMVVRDVHLIGRLIW